MHATYVECFRLSPTALTYSRIVIEIVDWISLVLRTDLELVDDESGGVAVKVAHRDLQLDVVTNKIESCVCNPLYTV